MKVGLILINSPFKHQQKLMPVIVLQTKIKAPIERCFNLSRSIDLHKVSTAHTREQAIDGVTTGLINLGE